MTDARTDLLHLYDLEYGETPELVIRLVGILLGSVVLYFYTGWISALAWSGIYLALHGIHYWFIRSRLAKPVRSDVVAAGLLFAAILVAFVWLPALLAAQPDPSLSYFGVALFSTTMVFLIRRADRALWMVVIQIAIMVGFWMWISLNKAVQTTSAFELFGLSIVTFAVALYLAQAMLMARRARLVSEEAAERAKQEHKMSAIGRLAGGVAHDFNNVLTVIKGNLELYHVLDDPAERAAVLREAETAAARAETVVRQLLVYARKAPVSQTELDCGAAVDRAVAMMGPVVPPQVTLLRHPDRQNLRVLADESLLTSALLNLVRNAVDAIDGKGAIRIRTEQVDLQEPRAMADGSLLEPDRYCRISVEDTGPGIPEASRARVLDPFFTTKPVGQGTGLGLSMVLGFVRGAGGGMTLDSDSRGTRVQLYLPAIRAAEAPDERGAGSAAEGVLALE